MSSLPVEEKLPNTHQFSSKVKEKADGGGKNLRGFLNGVLLAMSSNTPIR